MKKRQNDFHRFRLQVDFSPSLQGVPQTPTLNFRTEQSFLVLASAIIFEFPILLMAAAHTQMISLKRLQRLLLLLAAAAAAAAAVCMYALLPLLHVSHTEF